MKMSTKLTFFVCGLLLLASVHAYQPLRRLRAQAASQRFEEVKVGNATKQKEKEVIPVVQAEDHAPPPGPEAHVLACFKDDAPKDKVEAEWDSVTYEFKCTKGNMKARSITVSRKDKAKCTILELERNPFGKGIRLAWIGQKSGCPAAVNFGKLQGAVEAVTKLCTDKKCVFSLEDAAGDSCRWEGGAENKYLWDFKTIWPLKYGQNFYEQRFKMVPSGNIDKKDAKTAYCKAAKDLHDWAKATKFDTFVTESSGDIKKLKDAFAGKSIWDWLSAKTGMGFGNLKKASEDDCKAQDALITKIKSAQSSNLNAVTASTFQNYVNDAEKMSAARC